jgi:hypothetical protein
LRRRNGKECMRGPQTTSLRTHRLFTAWCASWSPTWRCC